MISIPIVRKIHNFLLRLKPSPHLTYYIPTSYNLYFANSLATVFSEPSVFQICVPFPVAYIVLKNPSNFEALCNIS